MLAVVRCGWRPWAAAVAPRCRAVSTLVGADAEHVRAQYGVTVDEQCNIPPALLAKVGRNLHLQPRHPLNTIKQLIQDALQKSARRLKEEPYAVHDRLSPFVTTQQNFDDLLTPPDHVSRRPTDTYYANASTILRTHTSAHQTQLIRAAENAFLVAADVYRRDEIDASHYPVFHQIEAVRLFPVDSIDAGGLDRSRIPQGAAAPGVPGIQPAHSDKLAAFVEKHLKDSLNFMLHELFGDRYPIRWVDAYFPFTRKSWEVEIEYAPGEWMEVLGCGVIQQHILERSGCHDRVGWALGMGVERLAMLLFEIPDIRLFWSQDPRFLQQFESGQIVKFQPYSRFPPCYKDITFWQPAGFHENDFFELVRSIGGDLVENVKLIDKFEHPQKGRSTCYRIMYRSMDRSLTNDEINVLQQNVRDRTSAELGCTLR